MSIFDPHALIIYIDGSAFKNPGHNGGVAGIAEYPEPVGLDDCVIFCDGYFNTTNNRMELLACNRALEYIIHESKTLRVNRAIIVTDSSYIYQNQNLAQKWKANHWRNEHGRPVDNDDLWSDFLKLRFKTPVPVDIRWLRGKSILVAKEVDRLAKAVAQKPRLKDSGYRVGKVAKTTSKVREATSLFPACNQTVTIRVYRYTLIKKNEHKVLFEVISDNGEVLGKHIAYASLAIGAKLHRHGKYKCHFNNNPSYPIIESVENDIK